MASIRRMQKGAWQAVVRRKRYAPQFHTFQSQRDARKRARQVESETDRSVFVDRAPGERATMGDLIDRHIADRVRAKNPLVPCATACAIARPNARTINLAKHGRNNPATPGNRTRVSGLRD